MLRTAVALRHVAFEDLGSFQTVLEAAGYKVRYYDIGVDALWTLDPVKTALVIVLGGPIGVYETERYPFLAEELNFLRARLAEGRPTLGICLGAQLVAAALGAAVASTGAYCRAMASNYNHVPRPPVVAVRTSKPSRISERAVRSRAVSSSSIIRSGSLVTSFQSGALGSSGLGVSATRV